MGRLFWKFFALFWLAQIITPVAIGVVFWVEHQHVQAESSFWAGPPPGPLPLPQHQPPAPVPLLPMVIGGFVSLLFAAILARYFAKPIRNLRSAFKAVSRGQLQTRIAGAMPQRNDELADLGKEFDQMAGRLETLVNSQRRLFHDVSHELRSPLARLQAAADLINQQPQRSAEFATRIERDTQRMDTLVGELLTLARLETEMISHRNEGLNLQELLAAVADDAHIEAAQKNCTIDFEVAEPLMVQGSRELLLRAFENIIRNAVRYTQATGRIKVVTSTQAGRVKVSISDSGPGVIGIEVDTIFEPFVRGKDNSSNSGYGLGLAITKRVIDTHGGSVSARNGAHGGLTVEVILPLIQAYPPA